MSIPAPSISSGNFNKLFRCFLKEKDLSSYQTVIIFDNRGAGESSIGTKEYSITQLANDTAGLLDALKIDKADVLGHSMGSFIAKSLL